MIAFTMLSEAIGIFLVTMITIGYFYPELLMNMMLSIVKDKKTGAFDMFVEGTHTSLFFPFLFCLSSFHAL